MLNTFRESLKASVWPKLFLLVVAFSMTLYLGAFFFDDERSAATESADWVARIDGEPIPSHEFKSLARRIDQNYRQLFGQNYGDLRQQFAIGTQALRQLVEQQLIVSDARRLGLSVSDDELIERIRTAPELLDANGVFIGKQQYATILSRQYPGGVVGFENDLKEEILIDKWTNLVSQAVSVDDRELEQLHRERSVKAAIDYVVVPSADQTYDMRIDDGDLRSYYEENAARYRREAGKRIRYVVVKRQDQLSTVEITDDDVRAAYEANSAEHSHPEQQRARHILFRFDGDADDEQRSRIRVQAEKVLERLRAGEEFEALARAMSQDTFSAERGGDLGWFSRGQMVPSFEEAAFTTAPGEFAPVTETQFGVHVIQVTGTREAGVLPLEEVSDEIRSRLRVSRADERTLSVAQSLRAAAKSPDDLAAAAAAAGLEVQSTFVSPGEGMQPLGASEEFRTAVLEMQPGSVSPPLRLAQGLAVVVVDEDVAAGVAALEDVDARVRTELLNDRARAAALAVAERALAAETNARGVAKRLRLEVAESGDLGPGEVVPGTGGNSPEMREALFGSGARDGASGVVPVPAGALVYTITRAEPFDAVAFASVKPQLRDELLRERQLSMRRSIVDQLGREREIEINEPMVAQLDG